MEQEFPKSDNKGRSASIHIDECLEEYPGPVDIARCLAKQWMNHPVETTVTMALGIGLVGFSILYIPIKVMARRSSNEFIRNYLS